MTEQHGELGVTAAGRDLRGKRAGSGNSTRSAAASLFGDVEHVYWDEEAPGCLAR